MDKYKVLIFNAHKEYLNRCYGLYAHRGNYKHLVSMTHYYMILISYDMLLGGLY